MAENLNQEMLRLDGQIINDITFIDGQKTQKLIMSVGDEEDILTFEVGKDTGIQHSFPLDKRKLKELVGKFIDIRIQLSDEQRP